MIGTNEKNRNRYTDQCDTDFLEKIELLFSNNRIHKNENESTEIERNLRNEEYCIYRIETNIWINIVYNCLAVKKRKQTVIQKI